jgi:DNA-binding response OmpR family regulator
MHAGVQTAPKAGLILVVEDDPRLREPLAHLLRQRQYDVICVESVDAAIEALHIHRPDAGIIDLQLGDGSGRDVIIRMPPRAPVIIFSGMRTGSGELERLRPRTRLVEKPASLTWLIDTLDDMVGQAKVVGSRL